MSAQEETNLSGSSGTRPGDTAQPRSKAIHLERVTDHPLNAETPLKALTTPVTPTDLFYVRCNFAIPDIDTGKWRLTVDGAVEESLVVSMEELHQLPQRTIVVTLECAGNGRKQMRPVPKGTPWDLGAVSTASFTGVSLRDLLKRVQLADDVCEVLFRGADGGELDDGRTISFERSLPLDAALQPDVLLAWAMNDEPLTREHGAPLRVVVPGWYGMASVKWLTAIHLLTEPFEGYFQTERYVYRQKQGTPDGTPVTKARVRSIIASPNDGAELPIAPVEIKGTAWSGHGPVTRVEVSTDGGTSWTDADLGTPASEYAAAPWRYEWLPSASGTYRLLSRATDAAGNRQPMEQVWNAKGYGNNMVQRVEVHVTE